MNKLILLFIVGVFIGFIGSARADSRHNQTIYNTYTNSSASQTANNNVTAALSAAADQHHFDWSTDRLQLSAGIGSFGSDQAISFGASKRFGEYLFSGSTQSSGNARSSGVGITGRF